MITTVSFVNMLQPTQLHLFSCERTFKTYSLSNSLDFPGGLDGNESVCNVEDPGLIPGTKRSPAEGNGNQLKYFCLENSMDRGAWQAIVCRVTKSQTQLRDFPLRSFQIYDTIVLLTLVTMLYITSPGLIYLITKS